MCLGSVDGCVGRLCGVDGCLCLCLNQSAWASFGLCVSMCVHVLVGMCGHVCFCVCSFSEADGCVPLHGCLGQGVLGFFACFQPVCSLFESLVNAVCHLFRLFLSPCLVFAPKSGGVACSCTLCYVLMGCKCCPEGTVPLRSPRLRSMWRAQTRSSVSRR